MRGLLKILAWMPLGVLYCLSGGLIYPLLRAFRYRQKVVRENLEKCFPEKNEKELKEIERKFYRNFADSIVETVKLLHIGDEEMMQRVTWEGLDVLEKQLDAGRSVAIYFSHCFNWEWAPCVTLHLSRYAATTRFCQIYRPLRSKNTDDIMLGLRSRFGSLSLPKTTALRSLLKLRREGLKTVTGFMSDQHPSHGDPGYLTTLLGRPTRMITGTETLARKMAMSAAYWDVERTGRGRFRITTRLISDDVSQTAEGEVTEEYTRLLESTIRRDPSNWLWSHNRWKHQAE